MGIQFSSISTFEDDSRSATAEVPAHRFHTTIIHTAHHLHFAPDGVVAVEEARRLVSVPWPSLPAAP